ncbi:sigma-70 family RNA polymerase sigma factor [Crocosphaera watsonii]|uniref:sigma-70 family RNA polymerase sigma factor n=1 Tax=Crocosphaera watsonii TaxID=263511 RepID=UPI00065141D2|nr:sigma-70 family RNA polymerase sigma factor [Crocosphaera watsonii]
MSVLADNPANATETKLVLRCQEGDTLSFQELYRRYQQRIRATLYQLCGSEMLDDLVQEVFLRVWKGLPKLKEPSYFSTWVYRITWNVATDKRRKFAQNLSVNDDGTILNIMPSRPQDTPDLMRLHYQDLVQQGLQSLSLEHRAVLVLHDLEDVPQKEVAKILELSIGTVKSRLFYARKQMRKFLKEQGAL